MTLRELPENTRTRLLLECDREFQEWFERTDAVEFGTKKPLPIKEVWRIAYSRAVTNILKRVDKLKQ